MGFFVWVPEVGGSTGDKGNGFDLLYQGRIGGENIDQTYFQ